MRVLQIIDSLDAGGAERMAVNLANLLTTYVESSYLCSTRKEGALKNALSSNVSYFFLGRTKTIDLVAFKKLKSFIKNEKITHIHAHGTSYLIATWIKWRLPNVKLIWHEHHGNRINTSKRENRMLVFCSSYFDSVISVNEDLQKWGKRNLKCQKNSYLPNFIPEKSFQFNTNTERENSIVCLANLRDPKDHINLLNAFKVVNSKYPEWELWLIGKDFKDEYSDNLKAFTEEQNLSHKVKFLGQKDDILKWMVKAKIGVLSSKSEGFPMALLEYGAANLGVISTNVGYCANIVGDRGIMVEKEDSKSLELAICNYIENNSKRESESKAFQEYIFNNFSDETLVKKVLKVYTS